MLNAIKSIDTGFRWQTFNGTDLRLNFSLSIYASKYLKFFVFDQSFSSYMNNNNASWVNGEDLKYEYTYFSKDMIAGKETLFCDKTILSESVINVIL